MRESVYEPQRPAAFENNKPNAMGRGLKGSEMSWLDVLGRRNERRSWRTIWKLSKGTPDESHTICRTIFWRQGSQVPRYQELIEFLWMVRTVWITLGCLLPWDHLVNMAMEHLPWMCIVYGKERCLRNIWQLYLFTRGCNICGLSLLILVDPCLGPFSNQHGFKWQICGWKGSSKRACPAGKLGSEPILVGKKSMEIHSGLGSSNCMRAAIQKKHTI